MDTAQSSIIWGLILFMVGILVPIIPAVLIYKLFPDDKIKAEGVIGQLKINATGAFGGYIIVLVIARFMVPQIYTLILDAASDANSPWVVKSKVVFFKKEADSIIPDNRITRDSVFHLKTTSRPDFTSNDMDQVIFTALYKKGLSYVTFSYPGFDDSTVDLTDNTAVKFNNLDHTIELGEIRLVRTKQEYNPGKFQVSNNRPDYIPFDGPATN